MFILFEELALMFDKGGNEIIIIIIIIIISVVFGLL